MKTEISDSILTVEAEVIRLYALDNVVIARTDLAAGTRLREEGVVTRTPIPAGHKVATVAIGRGEAVRKYGQIIGYASRDIAAGDHVHSHNLAMGEIPHPYRTCAAARVTEILPEDQRASFRGIRRSDGRVGTRNYIGVLTTVNCSATVAGRIADAFSAPEALADFPNVDGVAAFLHRTGCGMQADGEGHDILRRVLAGYARHPNFAGILFIGLGCEVNQIEAILEGLDSDSARPVRALTIQDSGGTRTTVEQGVAMIREMLPIANAANRRPVPSSELVLALQCGGSDAYSGITANPALGAAVDLLVRHGGTAILSETPEIYGAEHLLLARAASTEVADKLLERIRWWEAYTARHGGEMNNNPSPGNKAGGLTTIVEKSLGAVAKGGTTRLNDVYRYAEPVTSAGLVFMDSPGYDPASVTGQVAAGANMICFTTGRGSVFGFKPVPSIKLATTTDLYRRMEDDMDINCGLIADGEATVQDMGERIFKRILEVASGTPSRSEALGFGDHEFVPWQVGAVM